MVFIGDYVPGELHVDLPVEFTGETVLANLESPIMAPRNCSELPVKSGPRLVSQGVGVSEDVDVSFAFSLANNHIMDYGVPGLKSTLEYLHARNIVNCGAGLKIEDARTPMVLSDHGKYIGVIGCCESQFGSRNRADFGPWIIDAIRRLRSKVDYVIVSCHAAMEDCPFPSPFLRTYYRQLIDAGADFVHGHHSHIVQGWEEYGNGVIFYGLGNAVVDPRKWPLLFNRQSLAVVVDFSGSSVRYSVRRCQCEMNDCGHIALSCDKLESNSEFVRYIDICRHSLRDDYLAEGYWQEMSLRLFDETYGDFLCLPYSHVHKLTIGNRIHYAFWGLRKLVEALLGRTLGDSRGISDAANIYNCFQCISHSEMIKSAMGVRLGNVQDARNETISHNCGEIMHMLRH